MKINMPMTIQSSCRTEVCDCSGVRGQTSLSTLPPAEVSLNEAECQQKNQTQSCHECAELPMTVRQSNKPYQQHQCAS
jgi:hypothetical protein